MTNFKIGDFIQHRYFWWMIGTPFSGGWVRKIPGDGSLVIAASSNRTQACMVYVVNFPNMWKIGDCY